MKPISTHHLSVIYALLLAGFTLALSIPALADSTAPREDAIAVPVTINPILQIDDDYVRLGDIFTSVERYADRTVIRAPEPGEELVLPAVWLWKAAKTFGVDWKPVSTADTVTVSRPSSLITAAQIDDLLKDAFFKRTGEDDLIELETDGGAQRIHMPLSVSPTARLERFDYDARSGRFTASLIAPAEGRPLRKLNLSGRFHRVVELPVPSRRLGNGHIIEEGDIVMVRMREGGLGTNLIVDPARLIGQSVTRSLSAGKPVQLGSVRAPVLVQKGRIVNVTLRTHRMVLTVQGRAMEHGALHEVVRIQNTQSNTVIDAVVTGEGRVEVGLQQPLAMQID